MNHEQNCSILRLQLMNYLDDELDAANCTEIEQHLEDCEKCCLYVKSIRKTIEICKKIERDENLPLEIRRRLFLRLEIDEFLC